jgi:hypothetical protein
MIIFNCQAFKQTSKYVGVNQMKSGKWRCYIHFNNTPLHIGVFPTENEAYQARENKRIELGL